MLDLRFIRNKPDVVRAGLEKRGAEAALDRLLALDGQWRAKVHTVEQLKNERNTVSEEIGRLKKTGADASQEIEHMRIVSGQIKAMDQEIKTLEEELRSLLLLIPNIPHASVPLGGEEDYAVIRFWGQPREFDFHPKPHWDLGVELDILDFERAAKMAGARFCLYKGAGALLERALINFMLDLHTTEHGYTEMLPPFMVNADTMVGTGQLPKFAEDMFQVKNNGFYLIPTAEVPITNVYRDEVLSEDDLPIYITAYTPCFRAEAGAHGRDTRGLIRLHQFNKVELVKFVTPESSSDELEKLTENAERILQLLRLPYRVVALASADLGFSAAKTYDLEVWMPSYNDYKEISSCSNFEDFQARRANIRYRPADGGKLRLVHTLNGSGLAVGRTVAAIIENMQQSDGTVVVPEVLRPYMGGFECIEQKELIREA
jgi:seryl-tRNA synthetase